MQEKSLSTTIFKLSGTFKTFFRKLSILSKIWKSNSVVRGGPEGKGMLFASLWRIAYKNWYVTHTLYLNTFETVEKMEPDNYD